jgi:hypothetical protein
MFRSAAMLAALSLGAVGAAPAQTSAASTTVVKYSARDMKAQSSVSGNCWTSSIASPRADAYRCMTGNTIYDPCFVINSKSVGCPTDLSAGAGIDLKLTKPLPPSESPLPTPQAWAMVLQSNAHCNRATGTIDPDFPYYCSGPLDQCAGPNLSVKKSAYFVKCARFVNGKPQNVKATLVKTVYE